MNTPDDHPVEPRSSVFSETGAYLNEADLKAFQEGMKKVVEPTEALISAIRQAKSIRRA